MNFIILNCVICVIILNSVSALRRGSSCNSGYGDGICKIITQCNVLSKMRKNNQVPQMCGFDSNGPIVCCPRFSPREPETDRIEFDFDSNMQKDEEYNHNPNYFSYETKDNSKQDYSSEEFGGWGRNNDYTPTTSFWSNNKKKTTTNNRNVRPHYDSTTEHSRSHENTYRPHRVTSIENDNYQPQSSRPNTYNTENFDSWNNNNNRKPSNNNNWSGERPSVNRPTSTKRPNYNTEDEYRPTVSNSNNWSEERPYNNRPSTSNSQNWNNQRPNSNSNGWSSEGTSFNNPSSSRPNNNFGLSWFTSDKDDEDDRPIWGDVPTRASTTQRTTTSSYNSWSKPQKRISQIKCDEYSELVTSQLRPLPLLPNPSGISVQIPKCEFNAASLIVGGDDAGIGEFPHMAAIGFRIRGTGAISWDCGGVLISEEYILTAAHCTFTDTNGKPKSVRLGGRDLLQDEDGEATEIAISQIIVHPQYDKNKRYNDIALLKLNRRVQFSKTIRPACLFDKDNIPVTKSIATGWGQTNAPRSTTSNILKKVELSLVSNYDCNQMFNRLGSQQSSLNQGITKTMLCAGERIGGRDTCQGDSGGPLQFSSEQNKCIHYVIGITSFGSIMCGEPESPGVYSKVSAFLPWIENIVWPE